MSALGQKRTLSRFKMMSGLLQRLDIAQRETPSLKRAKSGAKGPHSLQLQSYFSGLKSCGHRDLLISAIT